MHKRPGTSPITWVWWWLVADHLAQECIKWSGTYEPGKKRVRQSRLRHFKTLNRFNMAAVSTLDETEMDINDFVRGAD
jgi:hypothetical protein